MSETSAIANGEIIDGRFRITGKTGFGIFGSLLQAEVIGTNAPATLRLVSPGASADPR